MPETLELPARLEFPLFTYGLLKPDQPAFGGAVRDLVADTTPATVPAGALRYRDGLPLLDPDGTGGVEGVILRFRPGQERAAYDAVSGFEPRQHYRWLITDAKVSAGDQVVKVNVLQGRHPDRGSPDEWFTSWSADADPTLRFGLHAVRRIALEHAVEPFPTLPGDNPSLWERFFGLQSAYLLLWSAIERYSAFACPPAEDALTRVYRLGDDPAFRECVLAAGVAPRAKVADSRDPARSRRIREDGGGAMYAWESVRSTLGHPGRTAYADGALLRRSLVESHDAFRLLLLITLPGLADTWRDLDPTSTPDRWLLRPAVSPEGLG